MRNPSPSPSIRTAKMLCGLLCAAFLLASCSTTDVPNYSEEEVEGQFIAHNYGSLTAKAFNPIRVAMVYEKNVSQSDKNRFRGYVENSIETWLEPLRAMSNGSGITRDVVFTSDRNSSHIDVVIKNESGRSSYRPSILGSNPTINMKTDSLYNEGTWLHEFGHAFGLHDTYSESGGCKNGQYSSSIMCDDTTYVKLTADDIRGIRYRYCSYFSFCDGRDYLDMYGGSGGTPKAYECPGSKVLYGVKVVHGSVVDSVTPLCRYTNGNSPREGTKLGGNGGYRTKKYECSGTSYVTGLRLRTGWRVDSIEVRCSNGARSSRMGGSGGSSDKVYECPRSSSSNLHYPAAKGIRVKSGSVIDSLGLTCAKTNGYLY